MKRERYEKRLFRVFAQAGYSPSSILTVTPEQMVEIPNITVPNIRTVLFVQRKKGFDDRRIPASRGLWRNAAWMLNEWQVIMRLPAQS